MAIVSPRAGKNAYPPVPVDWPDSILGEKPEEKRIDNMREWNRKLSEGVNNLLNGKHNAMGDVTLTTSSLTTVVKDRRCGPGSVISLMATNADAGGEVGIWFDNLGTLTSGVPSFRINHGFDSRTRTFRYTISG